VKFRHFNHLLAWVFLALLFTVARPARAGGPHYVFAHYMVCYSTYGQNLQGYKRDIQEAQASGIDGFALDMPEYIGSDWYYATNLELIYEAAEQLGTGFKLFFSVEMTNSTSIVQMISAYAGRTNTFRYGGKVVVSTYGQNSADWSNGVFVPLRNQGISVFFIPHFWPNPVQELPSYRDVVNILATYSNILDGLYWFGAAGLPSQLGICNSNYNLAAHQAGKTFMACYSPHYWGCAQPSIGRRYFESDGGEGTITQWTAIITNQPDWVEITTWNDFNESTYISPINNPGQYEAQVQTPYRYCHAGYLELARHYIAWFKTGQEPPITQDALFYFYRTHGKNLAASNTNDIPVSWFIGDIADVIYNTVFLTAPAQLVVVSGTNQTTNSLPAGISNVRTPFAPGSQTFKLERNGKVVLSVSGPPIISQITNYDFFPASGFAYGLPSPTNLTIRVQGTLP
jgi:glucan endo-1,3-alpha-glucosidase